jgi:predicted exporter
MGCGSAQEKLELAFAQIVDSLGDLQLTQLVMSGPATFAVEARETIKQEAWRLTAIAVILVIPMLYTAYRSIRLVALSILPLATGIAVATAAVGLLFGFIHGITLAFGVTLIGFAIDYPIHVFSHLGRESPAEMVLQKIWATMGLGIATTALGFSALLLSGFPGLSQLACFAIIGLVVAGAVTRFVLPVFIPLGFAPASYTIRLTPLVDRIRLAYWMLPLISIVALGYLTLSETTLWERELANLSPISNEKKMLDRELRKELAAPDVREMVVITGETEQEVIEISEGLQPALDRLIRENALAGYEMAARYLPSWKKQRVRQTALPDASDLRYSLEGALMGLPFKENLFEPFIDAVGMAKRQQPLGTAHLKGTGLGLKLQSLLFTRDGPWVGLVLLRGVTQRDLLMARVNKWNPPYVTYVDLKNESNRLVTAYRNETFSIIGWGGLVIGIILLIGLRSVAMTLRVLLPLALSILLVIAFLHGIGERLSLFHLASLLLVVGIGVDYALFLSRSTSSVAERERTVFAVLICSVTTMLVFGVLAFSELPVLKAIGMTTASGSLFSLLSSTMLSRGHVAVDSSG